IPGVSAEEMADLKKMLQKETLLRKAAEGETNNWKIQVAELKQSEASAKSEISKLHKMLEDEAHQKEKLEGEIAILQSQLLQLSLEADEVRYT
ncbi:armadillo repeat-containing kinesin-like protein 3-like, partial [Trifolium medium]|nr:armadillo repeat-containing kinesin-like protein 3-like [Trifolium medium]